MYDWLSLLGISSRYLKASHRVTRGEWSDEGREPIHRTWCSWTTFDRLEIDAGYWTAELPDENELGEQSTHDGGNWGQPFRYDQIAHLVIPRLFFEDFSEPGAYHNWRHTQDIDGLSELLSAEGLEHRLSKHALEVKLY